MEKQDVIIIGAGAAGLMCAIQAGQRGCKVTVLEQSNKPGRKILMSGGGRCNFTNIHVGVENYISQTSHFCKSALSRYTPADFIGWVEKHEIPFHEKTLGQLFCDRSAKDIVNLLLLACQQAKVNIQLEVKVQAIKALEPKGSGFEVLSSKGLMQSSSLVIATGGLSIPSMGSSPFAYELAEQFGLAVQATAPGLVPFVLPQEELVRLSTLAGISAEAEVSNQKTRFRESILFTHKGLSGPAILQISSYWKPGESITIKFLPHLDLHAQLKQLKRQSPKLKLKTVMSQLLAKRLVEVFLTVEQAERTLIEYNDPALHEIAKIFQAWVVKPSGTEGYKTAEVTLGGVCCKELSSKTMEATKVPGLYFVGEAVDVTGWLGGYNFQWAWASGYAAGQFC